jgi:hypothetical protein
MKEHYMVQMYQSRAFAEADMKEWENKSIADRDDWTIMKRFFREKMTLNEAYTNNNEGNEANVYGSSANITNEQEDKLADMGDQIREYIQQITQAKENVPPPANTNTDAPATGSNTAADEMNKRMAKLENMISNMCNNNNNNNRGGGGRNNNNNNNSNNRNNGSGGGNNNNGNGNSNGNSNGNGNGNGNGNNNGNSNSNGNGNGNGNNNGNSNGNGNGNNTGGFIHWRDRPHKQRNMGVYCHSCGFHPVGENHTSANCGYKKPGHDDNATWTKRGTGGSTVWPTKVRDEQKTHESYAGKAAPTN